MPVNIMGWQQLTKLYEIALYFLSYRVEIAFFTQIASFKHAQMKINWFHLNRHCDHNFGPMAMKYILGHLQV